MLVRPFLVLFGVLIQRDSQRAEYLADRLAADVAGRDAAGSLLRKLHLRTTFQNIAKTAAARGEHADVLGDLRRWVADAPPSEWDRIDHVMRMEQTQIDSTRNRRNADDSLALAALRAGCPDSRPGGRNTGARRRCCVSAGLLSPLLPP